MHEQRKLDHIRITLEESINAPGATTGFEGYRFLHRALPEISKDEIDLSTIFLGKPLKAPLIVSAITGGTELSYTINRNLAIAAQALGIALAIGSQRPAIEDEALARTYQVRDLAPDIPLFGNLGAVQLNYGYGPPECRRAVEMIAADGLVLHLNPLQECIQPQGNTNFKGLLPKIAEVCADLSCPVVVKEVGCGISGEVAKLLKTAGVAAIDVAGSGGTSWALIEKHRATSESVRRAADSFADWGIPTALCLEQCRETVPDLPVIASGGIRNGIDAAKAVAMGASLVGMAAPLVPAAIKSAEAVQEHLAQVIEELRIAMFCLGARNLVELRRAELLRI